MDAVFLPDPLSKPALLRAILGPEITPAPFPARLADHALCARGDTAVLALVPQVGASVSGALVEIGSPLRDRLGFTLAALGAAAAPVAVTVATAACARPAQIWRAAARAPSWLPASEMADPEWSAHLVEAAAEVATHHPRITPDAARKLMAGISYRALGRVRGAATDLPMGPRSGLAAARDVETRAVARPYAAYFAVEEHHLRHRRFDGGWSDELVRAVFVSGDAVTVLPFDPRRRRVLLVEQFRAGPLARRDSQPWLVEPVAGRCDAGESVEDTARREAREEAGLAIGRLERVAGYYPSPAISAEHITSFVGEADLGDEAGRGGRLHGLASKNEDIRTLVLPLDEALALVPTGVIANAPLLVTLLWLAAERERLARHWGAP